MANRQTIITCSAGELSRRCSRVRTLTIWLDSALQRVDAESNPDAKQAWASIASSYAQEIDFLVSVISITKSDNLSHLQSKFLLSDFFGGFLNDSVAYLPPPATLLLQSVNWDLQRMVK